MQKSTKERQGRCSLTFPGDLERTGEQYRSFWLHSLLNVSLIFLLLCLCVWETSKHRAERGP